MTKSQAYIDTSYRGKPEIFHLRIEGERDFRRTEIETEENQRE